MWAQADHDLLLCHCTPVTVPLQLDFVKRTLACCYCVGNASKLNCYANYRPKEGVESLKKVSIVFAHLNLVQQQAHLTDPPHIAYIEQCWLQKSTRGEWRSPYRVGWGSPLLQSTIRYRIEVPLPNGVGSRTRIILLTPAASNEMASSLLENTLLCSCVHNTKV